MIISRKYTSNCSLNLCFYLFLWTLFDSLSNHNNIVFLMFYCLYDGIIFFTYKRFSSLAEHHCFLVEDFRVGDNKIVSTVRTFSWIRSSSTLLVVFYLCVKVLQPKLDAPVLFFLWHIIEYMRLTFLMLCEVIFRLSLLQVMNQSIV